MAYGLYQQLADPSQLAAAAQTANSPELWQQLMTAMQQRQQQPATATPTAPVPPATAPAAAPAAPPPPIDPRVLQAAAAAQHRPPPRFAVSQRGSPVIRQNVKRPR